ncbi:PaaI family thioesterase [Sciscionella sediminilitoris]|uniref:PaaI family thioesterase n=1 Tax=Sciscionella sediminilitoris TaxID=1445613 RepID=UPI0004DED37E|nr:PaaI family thioesterase [Sciscionella sp. SE31]
MSMAKWPPVEVEQATRHPKAPAPGQLLGEHYRDCFGCGSGTPGGLHLRTTAGEGATVRAEFKVSEAHQGAPGLAHGGVLTAAFDETLGAVCGLVSYPAVTGKLETDFLHPVPVGSVLHIDARVDGIAGRKLYTSALGRLDAPDGRLALRARALFIRVGIEHFREHGTPPQDWGSEVNP